MSEAPVIRINFGKYMKPSAAPCSFCGVDIPGNSGFIVKIQNPPSGTVNEFHLCSKCTVHSRQYEADVDLSESNPQHAVRLGF